MTHDEAMARLMACPAMPRGERLAWCFSLPESEVRDMWRKWTQRHNRFAWSQWYRVGALWGEAADSEGTVTDWVRYAAPLRRAREMSRNRREMNLALTEQFHRYMVDVEVGAALLEFFTDLSVLVRPTPAPCPFCAQEVASSISVTCVMCGAYGPEGTFDDVLMWNRVAIPAAFARLKGGA